MNNSVTQKRDGSAIKKLANSMLVRCPNCEQGAMFNGLFQMNPTCPVCEVRFERRDGESLGGMMFTLVFVELFSVGGFFLAEALFDPPIIAQLIFWIAFSILFCVLFYRNGRGLWVGVVYLTSGLYKDGEAPERQTTDWTQYKP